MDENNKRSACWITFEYKGRKRGRKRASKQVVATTTTTTNTATTNSFVVNVKQGVRDERLAQCSAGCARDEFNHCAQR